MSGGRWTVAHLKQQSVAEGRWLELHKFQAQNEHERKKNRTAIKNEGDPLNLARQLPKHQ